MSFKPKPYLYPLHSFLDNEVVSYFAPLNALFHRLPGLPTLVKNHGYLFLFPAAGDHPLLIYIKWMILALILIKVTRIAALFWLCFYLAGFRVGLWICGWFYDLGIATWYSLKGPNVWRKYRLVPADGKIIYTTKIRRVHPIKRRRSMPAERVAETHPSRI